jgi:hypothetical protein
MWKRSAQSRCRCGNGPHSPGADVETVRTVPAQMWKRSAQSRRRRGSRGGEADTCRERTVPTHPLHTRTGSVYPRCGMRSRSVVHWPHISLPQCRQWWLADPPHTNADRPAAPTARCNVQHARCNEWQACKVKLAACRHTRHATRIHVHAYMRHATYDLQRKRHAATQTNAVVPTSAVPLLARSHRDFGRSN